MILSMHNALSDIEHFGALVNQTFFPMACEPSSSFSGAFAGELQKRQIGKIGFAKVASTPVDIYRRRNHIGQAEDAVYLVKVQLRGQGVVCHRGLEAHLYPGDFVLCLTSEPYECHFAHQYAQAALAIPESLMEVVCQPSQHLGVRMDSKVGAHGLFSQFVASMSGCLEQLNGSLAEHLESNVVDLLSTVLNGAQETQHRDILSAGVKQEHLRRIRCFIRRHLNDEQLTPSWIANAHRISPRYLHMLFENENTSVSRYIQQLRLEYCKDSLSDQSLDSYSVSEIAYRHGFKSASHFSRVFRQKFGETAGFFRRNRQQSKTDT